MIATEIYTTHKMILDAIRKKVPYRHYALAAERWYPLFSTSQLLFQTSVQYFPYLKKVQRNLGPLQYWRILSALGMSKVLKNMSFNTYANLGAYICENCGCKRPDLITVWQNWLNLNS